MNSNNIDHIKRAEAERERERQQFRAGLDALERKQREESAAMLAGVGEHFRKRAELRESIKENAK